MKGVIEEAIDVTKKVKGTGEAIKNSKMFNALCQIVREISKDTNLSEQNIDVEDNVEKLLHSSVNGRGLRDHNCMSYVHSWVTNRSGLSSSHFYNAAIATWEVSPPVKLLDHFSWVKPFSGQACLVNTLDSKCSHILYR